MRLNVRGTCDGTRTTESRAHRNFASTLRTVRTWLALRAAVLHLAVRSLTSLGTATSVHTGAPLPVFPFLPSEGTLSSPEASSSPSEKASRPSTRRMHGAAGLQPPTCRFAVSRSQAWVGLAPRSRKSPWLLALCSERQPQLGEHRGVTRESSSLLRHLAGSSLSEEGA